MGLEVYIFKILGTSLDHSADLSLTVIPNISNVFLIFFTIQCKGATLELKLKTS